MLASVEDGIGDDAAAYLPTCLPAYLPTCLPAYLPTCLPAYAGGGDCLGTASAALRSTSFAESSEIPGSSLMAEIVPDDLRRRD